jgi:hypothetical protein
LWPDDGQEPRVVQFSMPTLFSLDLCLVLSAI